MRARFRGARLSPCSAAIHRASPRRNARRSESSVMSKFTSSKARCWKKRVCHSALSRPSTASPAARLRSKDGRPCRHGADADAPRRARRRSRDVARRRRRARAQPNLVATVGQLEVPRSAPNTIPGRVRFTLDLRGPIDAERVKAVDDIKATIAAIAARRGVSERLTAGHQAAAAHCDEKLSVLLAAAAERCGTAPQRMPSGAGHDAMAFDKIIPFAMLFVRCRGGVSHNPDEYAAPADIDIAARVLSTFLDRIKSMTLLRIKAGPYEFERRPRSRRRPRWRVSSASCPTGSRSSMCAGAARAAGSRSATMISGSATRTTPAIRRRARSFFIRAASARPKSSGLRRGLVCQQGRPARRQPLPHHHQRPREPDRARQAVPMERRAGDSVRAEKVVGRR